MGYGDPEDRRRHGTGLALAAFSQFMKDGSGEPLSIAEMRLRIADLAAEHLHPEAARRAAEMLQAAVESRKRYREYMLAYLGGTSRLPYSEFVAEMLAHPQRLFALSYASEGIEIRCVQSKLEHTPIVLGSTRSANSWNLMEHASIVPTKLPRRVRRKTHR